MSQRVTALAFLVAVILFFAWEKSRLQQQAAEGLRPRRNAVRHVATPKHLSNNSSRGASHLARHAELRVPPHTLVAHSGSPSTHAPPRVSLVGTGETLIPALDYGRVANASAACPLPVLHPGKFATRMGWGIRKSFPPCSKSGRIATATVQQGSVVVHFDHCARSIEVRAFGELEDRDFRRLTSTMDAENRQNELKERFADATTFSQSVTVPSGASSVVLPVGKPYALVKCGDQTQLLITAPIPARAKAAAAPRPGEIRNMLHIMIDSTSIYALRRGAQRVVKWLERVDRGSTARVHAMKHYHAVSCCSPGNQVPMYSGNMNGEGDFFINSEPHRTSRDWLWNIARDTLGFKTFWSLDNCPDKSARDYHAFPSVDSRVVAPVCLAGVLLSHKEATCLGGKFIDEQVIDGLKSFWDTHPDDRKFAAVQIITPHEESEKLLIEVDVVLEKFFSEFESQGHLNDTAVIFWSDHGINFGKYASTHDGEIEKMFPFANVVLPNWVSHQVHSNLHDAADKLTTPYDMYEVARSLLYHPAAPPKFHHDPHNPPLPRPQDSHIMASFQKKLNPVSLASSRLPATRNCWDANIPMEFCTCLPWSAFPSGGSETKVYFREAIAAHAALLSNLTALCHDVKPLKMTLAEKQVWPEEYKPKGKDTAKKIWMKPNRDMVRIHYETETGAGHGEFVAVFSVDKATKARELVSLNRVDAMQKKCGLTDKVIEQLCVCR